MTIPNGFTIGAVFPQLEIEADAAAIREFASGIEAMGFSHILAYDHVVGANIRNRPGWNMPYTHESPFHEPLSLFAYLAGCTRHIILSTGVIILPQRQTVLFGKQAANIDIFCGGRLRLGVGLGWNAIEYEALGMPFEGRGPRLDAQIALLRRLWAEDTLSVDDAFHRVSEAGINPLPVQRPIPVWIGGISPASMRRAARIGDGWMPVLDAGAATQTMSDYRAALAAAGRNAADARLENIVFLGTTLGGPKREAGDAVTDAGTWAKAGASGITIHTMGLGLRGAEAHLRLFRDIAERLGLRGR